MLAAPVDASPGPAAKKAGRIQAFDGIRGIGVVAVIAYHAGFSWAGGSYIAIAMFFTLSGYLITSLLLAEHESTGTISVRRFYARRVRRLLPLAAAGVVLGAGVAAIVGVDDGTRGDLLAALAGVANWRFILGGNTYNDLFVEASPVQHFWSLSVETQFYLCFPLLAAAALRRGRRTLLTVVVAGCLGSWLALAAAYFTGNVDFGYYSTITRAGEILLGSVLALIVGRPKHAPRASAGLTSIAVLATAALVWAGSSYSIGADYATGHHLAVLPAAATTAALLITACLRRGPVAATLSARPVQYVGRLSYALYVVHWPLFVLLSPTRTGWGTVPLTVVRLVAAAVVALAVHYLLELPALHGRANRRSRPRVGVVAGSYLTLATVALLAVGLVSAAPSLDADAAELNDRRVVPTAGSDPEDPGAAPQEMIAVFGDSSAVRTGLGLGAWLEEQGEGVGLMGGVVTLGCGMEPRGARRVGPNGFVEDKTDKCWPAYASWPEAFAETGATVALIQAGPWDSSDRRLEGTNRWQHLGEPAYDDVVRDLLSDTFDSLIAAGAQHVVWIDGPTFYPSRTPAYGSTDGPEADPARIARFNELAAEVAATRPEVHLVDLAGYIAGLSPEEEERLRPDGVHFTEEAGREVADWLGPRILAAIGAPAAH